jgi:hypothetical protein
MTIKVSAGWFHVVRTGGISIEMPSDRMGGRGFRRLDPVAIIRHTAYIAGT